MVANPALIRERTKTKKGEEEGKLDLHYRRGFAYIFFAVIKESWSRSRVSRRSADRRNFGLSFDSKLGLAVFYSTTETGSSRRGRSVLVLQPRYAR